METRREGEAQPQFPMGKKKTGGWWQPYGQMKRPQRPEGCRIFGGIRGERRSWERGWLEQRGDGSYILDVMLQAVFTRRRIGRPYPKRQN